MPRFLPVLRGGETSALGAAEAKAVFPVAFAQYYSDLQAMNLHARAKDWPIERAITEGFERVTWVFKSVQTIAADSARLPFRLRDGDDDDAPIVDDHPLYRVLNKKANPVESGQIFRKRLSAQILLSKRGAFVEVTFSNGGTIKWLDLLPPERTEIIPARDGGIDHFRLTRRDGSIKNIDPRNVRWFRDPHPLDPYMGVTPLEAAGMSVELDHFARLYNVAFFSNDGRPGGVLAVRDTKGGSDIDPDKIKRLEDKFGKGPGEAGKLSVVAGELDYVDLAAKPRDMQYGATSRNSKIEILSAFGVPESVLGYAADRTFANADAELYTYWTRTLPAHHEVLLTGFDEDSEDTFNGFFDTSKIEVLERAAREKRAEAREEFGAGLRSIHSYMTLADRLDEVDDTPHTRALFIATGKTPLPSREADAEALGLGAPVEDDGMGEDPGALPPGEDPAALPPGTPPGARPALPPGAPGAPAGTPALPAGTGRPPQAAPGAPPALGTAPATAPSAPGAPRPPAPGSAAAALAAVAGRKDFARPAGGGARPKVEMRVLRKDAAERTSDPDLDAWDRLEDELAATLEALAERWTQRTIARLQGHKHRKGTRHWVPEYDHDTRVGTKALDTARAVDEQTWQAEAEAAIEEQVNGAAIAAALALVVALSAGDEDTERNVPLAVAATAAQVISWVGRAAANQAMRLVRAVNEADQAGADLAAIVGIVRDAATRTVGWSRGVATQAATATINGARDAAAREMSREEGHEVVRVWVSRRDDRVRLTHDRLTGADGQIRGLDEPFVVGTALLMRPGDPLGPARETANCRCYLRHRSRVTGRWVSPPGTKSVREAVDMIGRVAANAEARFDRFGQHEPRDGDADGFVYDGTPRQRPVLPRVPVGGHRPPPAAGVGRPYAEVLERRRERLAREAAAEAAEAAEAPDVEVVGDRPTGPGAEGQAVIVANAIDKHLSVPDHEDRPPITAALVAAAAEYDAAYEALDPLAVAAALGRLHAAVAEARGFTGVLDDDALEALNRLADRSAVLRPRRRRRGFTVRPYQPLPDIPETFRGLPLDVLAALADEGKAVRMPRDGDGDGLVYDGTPRQRPAFVPDLRDALPDESVIARGASRIAKYRALARETDCADPLRHGVTWEDAQDALFETYSVEFRTRTGRDVRVSNLIVDRVGEQADKPAYLITGDLTDADTGAVLGWFERGMWVNDGKRKAYHNGLVVLPEAQGEGIAAEFNAHALAYYRQFGIERIEVEATGSENQTPGRLLNIPQGGFLGGITEEVYKGGFVWGEQGFHFTAHGTNQGSAVKTFMLTLPGRLYAQGDDLLWRVTRYASGGRGKAAQAARMETLDAFADIGIRFPDEFWNDSRQRDALVTAMRSLDPATVTPWELNQIGRDLPHWTDPESGEETWIGKSLMIRSTWAGYFDLSWLDVYPETKARIRRRNLLATLMLAALGSDEDYLDGRDPRTGTREGKSAAPIDGDGDGFIYDGTLRQRPASPRRPANRGMRVGTIDANMSRDFRLGYDTTWERMKDEPPEAIEQALRDLDKMRETNLSRRDAETIDGAVQALTQLHAQRRAVRRVEDPVVTVMPTEEVMAAWSAEYDSPVGGVEDALVEADNANYRHGRLDALTDMVRVHGITAPIDLLAPPPGQEENGYTLINGHHRALAGRRAGLTSMPVRIHAPVVDDDDVEWPTFDMDAPTEAPVIAHGPGRPDGLGTVNDPIDVQGDIELAARLIAEGKHVRLNRVDEVGVLLDKMREMVLEAVAKGTTAPLLDLCRVSVPGTNLFCVQSKGIPRVDMPQLVGHAVPGSKADALPRDRRGRVDGTEQYLARLAAEGIGVENVMVPASSLKATQADVHGGWVAGIMHDMADGVMPEEAIFVTRDGYVIDGHHRWAAKVGLDTTDGALGDVMMPVRRLDMEIGEALDHANAFAEEWGIHSSSDRPPPPITPRQVVIAPEAPLEGIADEDLETERRALRDIPRAERTPEQTDRMNALRDEQYRRQDVAWAAQQAAEKASQEKWSGWTEEPYDPNDGGPFSGVAYRARAERTKQRFVKPGIEVAIETTLDEDDTRRLLDIVDGAMDKARPLLYDRVTVRVPAPGTDKTFNRAGVGGYVTEGSSVVILNPGIMRLGELAPQGANHLGVTRDADPVRYYVTHEFGHVVDHQAEHTRNPEVGAAHTRRENKFWREWGDKMTRYGQSHAAEGYAEAWAHWALRDRLDPTRKRETDYLAQDEVANAYAARYGWDKGDDE